MPTQKRTEQELQEISKLLVLWNADWDNARPHFDDAKNDYLAYKMFRDPNSHPYKYNPSMPLVFTIVENLVSTSFNSFFLKDDPLSIDPVEVTHQPNPNVHDEIIARQLERVVNTLSMHPDREFMLDKYDLDMETVVYGNGYTMTIPEFDFTQESDIGGPVYLGPKVIPISFWDLIPDRECYRLSTSANCRRLWHKEWVSIEDYKNRMKDGSYKKLDDEELKKLASDKTWIPEDFHEDLLKQLGKGARPFDGINEANGTMLLLHYYDMYTGHYQTIAANKMLVRDTSQPQKVETSLGPITTTLKPYPYCPYDDIRLWPFPKEFFAQGVGKIARGFQNEINTLKSMRLENIELGIFKTFLVNDIYGIDLDDLVMIPGGIIPTRDVHNSVEVIKVDDITQNAYMEQAQWEKEAQDATNSQENMRGNAPNRRETATTMVQLQQNSMKRSSSFQKRVANWYKSVSLKKIIQIRTYMSQKEYERIIGESDAGFYQLQISEIKRMFDLRPSSTSLDQVREIDQQNFISAMQMAKGGEQYMNVPEWMKLGFELFFPTKNPDKYILAAPPQSPLQPGMPQPGQAPGASGSPMTGRPTIDPRQLMQMAGKGQLTGSQGR